MAGEASHLFRKLVFDINAEEWNEYDLPKLRRWELSLLCQLFGGPKTGKAEELVTRILSIRTVRSKIARYGSDRPAAVALAADFRKDELKWFCRHMKLWRSGSKIQRAITLLSWRDRARMEGMKLLNQLMAPQEPGGRPIQLQLGLAL